MDYFLFSDNTQQEPAVAVAVPSIDEFPALGERSSTPQNVPQRGVWLNDSLRRIHSSEEFPALVSATGIVPNANVNQARGIWREQQQTTSSTVSQNVTSKKASTLVKSIANGIASVNIKEDFPVLEGTSNTQIRAPISMFSAWSKVRKSARIANGKQ